MCIVRDHLTNSVNLKIFSAVDEKLLTSHTWLLFLVLSPELLPPPANLASRYTLHNCTLINSQDYINFFMQQPYMAHKILEPLSSHTNKVLFTALGTNDLRKWLNPEESACNTLYIFVLLSIFLMNLKSEPYSEYLHTCFK